MSPRVVFWSLTASLAGFLFGFDTVVISGAEQAIQKLCHLGDDLHGFAAGSALWGTVLGSLVGGWPADRFGRKVTLLGVGVLYFASAVGCGLAPDVATFIVARFVGGVGIGVSTVAAPLDIAEIAPPKRRGLLTCLFQFNIVSGILVAFQSNALLAGLGADAWRWMLGVVAVPALTFSALTLALPESPRWLLRRGHSAEGLRLLAVVNPDLTPAAVAALAGEIRAASIGMSWGHAVSADLVTWKHLPVALHDEYGVMAFSGSAVADLNNTSGLGTVDKPPLVAIYTGHGHGKQTQDLASSTDRGRTWTKFPGNPVLDIGQAEFRDPKVSWHAPTRRWVMVVSLATEKKLQFYSSKDLKAWTYLSDFGPAGVANKPNWECPDLFELPVAGEPGVTRWVLKADMGSGAVAGGSGGEYFLGTFDGKAFAADSKASRWVDYGRDFYAPISWSNVPAADGRRLWLGWMNNWETCLNPTSPWRSAMSVPREPPRTVRPRRRGPRHVVPRLPAEVGVAPQREQRALTLPARGFERCRKSRHWR